MNNTIYWIVLACYFIALALLIGSIILQMKMKDSEILEIQKNLENTMDRNKALEALLAQNEQYNDGNGYTAKVILDTRSVPFEEALSNLNENGKRFYKEIKDYFATLPHTSAKILNYHERLSYGVGKTIARIMIRKQTLLVVTNEGTYKPDNEEISSLELKPLKVFVTDEDSLKRAKYNIHEGYMRRLSEAEDSLEKKKYIVEKKKEQI